MAGRHSGPEVVILLRRTLAFCHPPRYFPVRGAKTCVAFPDVQLSRMPGLSLTPSAVALIILRSQIRPVSFDLHLCQWRPML